MRVLQFLAIIFAITIYSCKVQQKSSLETYSGNHPDLIAAMKKADISMESEEYEEALGHLLKVDTLLKYDPEALFLTGMCYYNLKKYDPAQVYFDQAANFSEKEYIPIDAYFYQGKTYYLRDKSDSALMQYTFLEDTLRKLNDKRFLVIVQDELKRCNKLMGLKETPITWDVVDLGGKINSEYADHSPVINGDETVLIFTSKRAGQKDPETGEYLEDIYISHKKNGVWTEPEGISDSINTPDHEASIGLSADGQQLFIYKPEENGSIYVSKLEGDVWTRPKKLGKNINSSGRETHASLSADGRFLYFTSDRNGGYGGTDIYVSERQPDGTWGEAKNLGYGVNSRFDEEGPYIHPDGKTLYFSSKGHNSIGGFDIYQTERNEFNTWTRPRNIGYPVNTVNDDVFFVLSADGRRAYYSSHAKNTKTKADIFLGNLPDNAERPLTIMIGHVTVPCGELPYVNITVNDMETDEIVGIYVPNSKTGKFIFFLDKGRDYALSVEANDEEVLTDTLIISPDAKYEEVYKNIPVPPVEICPEYMAVAQPKVTSQKKLVFEGDKIEYDEAIGIRNIIFPSGSTRIRVDKSLDELAKYLRNNPKALVEIGGHSDSKGAEKLNYRIAKSRAVSAQRYLLRKGVKADQLKVVSYGPSTPIAINQNADGSYNNEAMKFNRRIEFKVLRQGKSTLKILPIDLVPEKWRVTNLAKRHF